MKLFLAIFILPIFLVPEWQLDFDKARQSAQADHKLILLNFSGSDWCGPCIRMQQTIFNTEGFESFAKDKLILVKADFPRLKKNALSKEQQKKNEQLADVYNNKGLFPFTLLLSGDGKILKSWEGLAPGSSDELINQIQPFSDASH